MILRVKFTILLLALCISFIGSSVAHAQIPTSIDGLQIFTFPSLPEPGQKTNVTLESFSTDLNAASILWLVDGKEYAKGVGTASIDITAPVLGKTKTILAIVKTVEGKEVRKSITLKTGSVDIVWESEGFIPQLYKGKAPFVYENTLKVVAIPHLAGANEAQIDPATLVYKWTKNDKVIQDQSGYGKQTLIIQEELPRTLNITVEVSTPNGNSKASKEITLTPGDPSILFYEDDPLYGVFYNKAIKNNLRLVNQEVSIRATPYGFTVSSRKPLSFNWSINNLERSDLSTNESITLRTRGDVEGSSAISLEIRNINNILQGARNAMQIVFTKQGSAESSNATFQ